MISILVADDDEVGRVGIRALLERRPGWKVCAEVSNGRDAVAQAKHLKPDVAVLDILMPQLNGLAAARQIHKALPRTELLILTIRDSEEMMREALDAGARGILIKSNAGHELVAAVEALSQHKPYFTSKASELMWSTYMDQGQKDTPRKAPRFSLSAREREILQLLAEGKSNKEAAAALTISVNTVEAHRANIMRKLGLHSIADLVHYAIRNQMVAP